MSNTVLPSSSEFPRGAKSDEKDAHFRLTTDEGANMPVGDNSGDREIIIAVQNDDEHSKTDSTAIEEDSDVVHALEKELNERRKQIVTSFKLQELSSSSGLRVKSDAVVREKAEEQ